MSELFVIAAELHCTSSQSFERQLPRILVWLISTSTYCFMTTACSSQRGYSRPISSNSELARIDFTAEPAVPKNFRTQVGILQAHPSRNS